VLSASTSTYPGALEEVRHELVRRLRARGSEIEEVIFAHVRTMSEPPDDTEHAEYIAGLHAAVVGALDFVFTSIALGEESLTAIPAVAAAQARRAARTGVSLDTVLRRYAAGERHLVEFIIEEAGDVPNDVLRHLLRLHGLQVDRFMKAVAAEYMDELDKAARSPERRLLESVEKLLGGEPVDASKLDYELEARWHLGIVAMGVNAIRAVKDLAETLGRRLLFVQRGEHTVWAWLGGSCRLSGADIERSLLKDNYLDVSLAIGEPARDLDGWRLTHRQAQAAVWVALRKPQRLTRYADDLLLAAVLRDDVLAKSLMDVYFLPLCSQRDGGVVSRETLRAYFSSGRNAATAAAFLRVDRHTVQRRLRKIEERLGRLLDTCYAELEIALRLDELDTVNADRLALNTHPAIPRTDRMPQRA
jgi:PucR C-terminal helix-turn-helix domain/GGDEF-like domain